MRTLYFIMSLVCRALARIPLLVRSCKRPGHTVGSAQFTVDIILVKALGEEA